MNSFAANSNLLLRTAASEFHNMLCLLTCEAIGVKTEPVDVSTTPVEIRAYCHESKHVVIENSGAGDAVIYEDGITIGISKAGEYLELSTYGRGVLTATSEDGTTIAVGTMKRCSCNQSGYTVYDNSAVGEFLL